MTTAISPNLTYEDLTAIWHNGITTEPGQGVMTPTQARLEETFQTELFFDKDWERNYGVWGERIGERLPSGLMVGSWDIRRFRDDEETGRWRSAKIITTAGKNALAAWLAASSQSSAFSKFLGIGTSSTAAAVGDTALGGGTGNPITEVMFATGSNRGTGTASSASNVYQVTATSTAGQINGGTTATIAEAGMFSVVGIQTVAGTPNGTMYDRTVLGSTAVITSADTLQLTFQITFS
jgi:hypothetical protein